MNGCFFISFWGSKNDTNWNTHSIKISINFVFSLVFVGIVTRNELNAIWNQLWRGIAEYMKKTAENSSLLVEKVLTSVRWFIFGNSKRAKTLDGYDLVIYFVKSYPFEIIPWQTIGMWIRYAECYLLYITLYHHYNSFVFRSDLIKFAAPFAMNVNMVVEHWFHPAQAREDEDVRECFELNFI